MLPDIYAPGVPRGLILGKLDGHRSRIAFEARNRRPQGPPGPNPKTVNGRRMRFDLYAHRTCQMSIREIRPRHGVGGHSAPPCKLFCISVVPNAMRVRSQVLCPNSNRIRSHPMRQKYIVGPDGSATLGEALKTTS